jgi:hypothetical protein
MNFQDHFAFASTAILASLGVRLDKHYFRQTYNSEGEIGVNYKVIVAVFYDHGYAAPRIYLATGRPV